MNQRSRTIAPLPPRGPDYRNTYYGNKAISDMIADSEQRDREKRAQAEQDKGDEDDDNT